MKAIAMMLVLVVALSTPCFSQDTTASSVTPDSASIDTDSATIHMQIDELFESAKRSFGDIKGSKTGMEDGKTMYSSKLELLGSSSNSISVDSERSHVFQSKYAGLGLEEAKTKQEELTAILYKRVNTEGFKRAKGSDFRYYQYRMNTVEFDSDNIDELGKRPSFTIGILKEDDDTYSVVLSALDPLWK